MIDETEAVLQFGARTHHWETLDPILGVSVSLEERQGKKLWNKFQRIVNEIEKVHEQAHGWSASSNYMKQMSSQSFWKDNIV